MGVDKPDRIAEDRDMRVPWSDEEVRALGPERRAELVERLAQFDGAPTEVTPKERRRYYGFLMLTMAATVGLLPWMVVVGLTLPAHYVVRTWQPSWIGFGAILCVSFAVTAWATWQGRRIVVFAAGSPGPCSPWTAGST